MLPTVHVWLRDTLRATQVVPVSLDAEMATDAASFHAMHADPFDLMIVAAAIHARARLATADTKIIEFARRAGVQVLEL
jgi:PIN domain nuclease of toxin-antitoxin system